MFNIDELVLNKIKASVDNLITKMEYERQVCETGEDKHIHIEYGKPTVTLKDVDIPITYSSETDKEWQELIYSNATKR